MMNKIFKKIPLILGGALVGIANGLFGGGGGMLAVPILSANGLKPVKAHATAIAVILPVTLFSGAVYAFQRLVPLEILIPTAFGVAAGGYFGAGLLGVLPEKITSLIFALIMVAAGARMLFS